MAAREPYPQSERRERGRVLSPVEHYGRIPVRVLFDASLDDASKVLYAYLTTWDFRRTGRMFGGREDFAEALSWSLSKVGRTLGHLERAGCIRRIRRGHGLVNDIMLLGEVREVTDDPQDGSPTTHQDTSLVTLPNTRENARENQEEPANGLSLVEQEPKTRRRTARDDYYDALETAFGKASTASRRAFYGRTVTQLIAANAEPGDIARAAAEMRVRGWENASPEAMLKHWDDLLRMAQLRSAGFPLLDDDAPADLPRPDPRSFTKSRNPEPW